jgi:ABC-2 type transport system ATP-binding protein
VGDAAFQQKCLDRMRAVLAQGTTLVFVSHDLAAVEATCNRGVWLHNGSLRGDGPVRDVLGQYRRSIEEAAESAQQVEGLVQVVKVEVDGADGSTVRTQEPLVVRSVIESSLPRSGRVFIGISDGPATPIFVVRRDAHLVEGETEITCEIARLPLPRGRFYVWAGVFDSRGHELLPWHPLSHMDVTGPDLDEAPRAIARPTPVHVDASWTIEAR